MESFSLLKYWRSGGSTTTATVFTADSAASARPTSTKTIVTAAAEVSPYSSDDGEEGPYFDLEFALPEPDSDADENPSEKSQETDDDEDETESGSDEEEEQEEGELKFAPANDDGCSTDQNAAFSPGSLVKIDENFKFPVSLVKSATKFRVLLLKFKKSKPSNNGDEADVQAVLSSPKIVERESTHGKLNRKFLAVKFKVDEVPFVSLFTRETSSKQTIHGGGSLKNSSAAAVVEDSDEKKLTKDQVVHKYLKMVKPFYVRVSKLKFAGHGGGSKACTAAAPSNVKTHPKQGNNNLQAGLEVVRKHLGKSRSASAAVAAAPPPTASNRRRDDSLLQVQDGIQGAILHCKRSFNAAAAGDVESSSILSRSVSDPSYEKSVMMQKASSSFSEEAK
ncbi:hypothetical protein ABFS82_01G068000 [Erythranthe guttata]|uniref:Membrane-associated kinase regulator 2 n=1 Tax=Erythranthe guttata TaxID=4155 RepID=A0A022Q893_ERYGU|nr:PREDICTED: probable membrane-associated kinase regulator 2 [Erythranthe guttata]EYU23413.1 hypothetical protein MIMGU_mgv1a007885mg [Erythranthe guttata]|eukprot:XP_012854337.1 PREDICTED: probable membrane-associated kinase regulator 2 [Erythranthe guttata]